MEASKTLRLLRLLVLLSGIKRYSVKALAAKFGCTERTIFRHLEEIEQAGFVLNRNNGYQLQTSASQTKTIQRILHFTEEEATVLYQLLEQAEAAPYVKDTLLKKLNVFYDLKVLEKLRETNELEKIISIRNAIKQKQQIAIYGYRSGNTNKIDNRVVEAFEFLPDYNAVWCYEPASKKVKQFKVSRMESVEQKNSYWQFEALHHLPFTDPFRMAAAKPLATVKMTLSVKAFNLLVEEFPLTKELIVSKGNRYHATIKVASYEGVGRFVLGLLDEIQVMEPISFQRFLKKKTGAIYQTKKDFQITDRI